MKDNEDKIRKVASQGRRGGGRGEVEVQGEAGKENGMEIGMNNGT